MRRSLALIAVVAIAAPSLAQDSGADVRLAFERYRASVLAGDGPGAVGAVSASTVAYYGRTVDLALDADSADVAALPFMDQVMALTLRHRLTPTVLRGLDGAAALRVGVEKGWVDMDSMEGMDIGEVDIEGDLAIGELVMRGERLEEVWLRFEREGGKWRVDMTSMMEMVSSAMTRLGPDDPSPRQMLRLMLEAAGGPLPDDLWHPVGR